ncbi:MAG: O-succinylbenzoate-CoA ligase [Desulfobacterales bacterium S7086C20]|nr:MAG: O-succinylbenzoate-CoA ligase [Desulfobacterales bacterium S7086C20]
MRDSLDRIECPVSSGAKRFAELPALICGDATTSYVGLEQMVNAVAFQLREAGVAYEERIAIISHNRLEYPILLFAILRLQAVACPISPRFPPESILSILRRIDCGTVFDPLNLLAHVPSNGIRKISLDALFDAARLNGKRPRAEKAYLDSEGKATIILTSGSSGEPKAVSHSFANHYFSALGSNKNITVFPGSRWLLALPLYHVGGLGIVFRTLMGGGAIVIPTNSKHIGKSIKEHGITHLSLVSTQLDRLLNEGLSTQTIQQLEAVLVGGGPTVSSLIAKAYDAGLPVHTTYGLTEMSSQVTTTSPEDRRDRLFTSGKVLDHRDLKVDNGQVFVKGKTLFKGYVKAGRTLLPVDDKGWFRTGDMGHIDSDGYLTLLGRQDNMFVSGGENVYPEEIEDTLCRLPDILQAVVIPIEDKEFGFRPVAFIKIEGNKAVDQGNIVSNLERYLPRFKIPVAFFKWPEKENINNAN